MTTAIGFHGTDVLLKTKDEILIDYYSLKQFYGPAFYVALEQESAKRYGQYIYEVHFITNKLHKIDCDFQVGTIGIFRHFLESVRYEKRELFWSELKIDKYLEKNEKKLQNIYFEIQREFRADFECDFDGIMDGFQCAIYNPKKIITKFQRIV